MPVDMTNFGATFKKARESKGISLVQVAKVTRISTRFLAAIENEEFHVLPGGIFNRGFVRAFAEHIGLDPEQAVADYERLVSPREPSVDVEAAAPPVAPKTERHLYPIAIGILAIAIAIFYILTRDPSSRSPEIPNPAPESKPTVQPDLPPPPPQTPPAAVAEPMPTPAAKPAPAPPVQTTQTMTLDIEVREPTWIKVTSDGNAVIPGAILERGATRKFTAENSIYISVGNAAGLSLKINDMPLKPLGKSGQVRTLTITPANMKDFIG